MGVGLDSWTRQKSDQATSPLWTTQPLQIDTVPTHIVMAKLMVSNEAMAGYRATSENPAVPPRRYGGHIRLLLVAWVEVSRIIVRRLLLCRIPSPESSEMARSDITLNIMLDQATQIVDTSTWVIVAASSEFWIVDQSDCGWLPKSAQRWRRIRSTADRAQNGSSIRSKTFDDFHPRIE